MLVAYVVSQFPNPYETFILEELCELKRRGIGLMILSLKPPAPRAVPNDAKELLSSTAYSPFWLSRALLIANLRFMVCRPVRFARLIAGLVGSLATQPAELAKTLAIVPKSVWFAERARENGCTRVHGHFCNVPTAAARMIASLIDAPFSFTAHGSDIYEYPPADLGVRIRDARPCITVSEYNRRHLAAAFPEVPKDGIAVVHCGIRVDRFNRTRDPNGARRLRILTVARLESVKGLDVLIDSCALLGERGVAFDCSIIGDGPERRTLESLIRRKDLGTRVHLLGSLPHEEVIPHYHRADIFVLPSRREGIPVSVMEAMAARLPVIGTNVTGLPEIIADGLTGLLVPPDDAGALASAISRLAEDRPAREQMASLGHATIEERFNVRHSVDRLLELWES